MSASVEPKKAKATLKEEEEEPIATSSPLSSPKGGKSLHKKNGRIYPQEPQRVPEDKPPFTVGDLKRAIPAHCFERSLVTSFGYLVMDLTGIAVLFYLTNFFNHPSLPSFAPYILWPAYWLLQGYIMTGLWVVAHECGHGAFSDYEWVNDTVGLVCHSYLLVPYFSWKITHAKHHSKTGNIEKDTVFVPREQTDEDGEGAPPIPLTLARIIITLLAGWIMYLFYNTGSNNKPGVPRPNHFSPYSSLFSAKERHLVVISDIGLLVVTAALTYLGYNYGFWWLFRVYGIPYLHTNFWLVLITNLQHTDLKIPHFRDEDWNWLQGALSTVDRDYGILNIFFHHIGDTHVAHHLFSRMPHYHAQEATKAIIPVLGKYYCKDDSSLMQAMWVATHKCQFVAPSTPESKALWFGQHRSKAE